MPPLEFPEMLGAAFFMKGPVRSVHASSAKRLGDQCLPSDVEPQSKRRYTWISREVCRNCVCETPLARLDLTILFQLHPGRTLSREASSIRLCGSSVHTLSTAPFVWQQWGENEATFLEGKWREVCLSLLLGASAGSSDA